MQQKQLSDKPGRRSVRWRRFAVVLVCAAAVVGQTVRSGGVVTAQGRSGWDGVYTDAQASRGETIYRGSCAVCHGDDLSGGEMGPGLAGTAFLEFWDGLSLGDLYQVMSVSMPQDNPGSLEMAQYVDVIAFMLQQSEFPSGSEELPADEGGLGEVMIKVEQ